MKTQNLQTFVHLVATKCKFIFLRELKDMVAAKGKYQKIKHNVYNSNKEVQKVWWS
jgi:hypothetical protein